MSFSSINNIFLSGPEVCGIYAVILLLLFFPFFNKRKAIIVLLFIFLTFSLSRLYQVWNEKDEVSITFYNTSSPVIHLQDNEAVSSILTYGKENHTISSHIQALISENSRKNDSTFPEIINMNENISIYNYIYPFHDIFICFLVNDYWIYRKTAHPLVVDYLYVDKGYRGTPEDINDIFKIKNVILDASVRNDQVAIWQEKCALIQVPVYLLEEGAVSISLAIH